MRLGEGFYLPSLQIAGAPGAPLIVEVTLGDARDRALLHARVGRVDEGGLWLDGIRTGLRWTPLPGSPCRRAPKKSGPPAKSSLLPSAVSPNW